MFGPHNHKVIAYARACDEMDLDEQYDEIEKYAKEHHLVVTETYCDVGKPMTGLHHAMEALENADALLVCNLNRLVTHTDDRLRDLRPLLHHFCSQQAGGKHLISIEEGINTSTPTGQMNAVEIINEYKDAV
jgi:DNA invertase Pin-like site-specific DNA recombinase